jgi:hypothetical protein
MHYSRIKAHNIGDHRKDQEEGMKMKMKTRMKMLSLLLAAATVLHLCGCEMSGAGDREDRIAKSSVTGNTGSGSGIEVVSEERPDPAEPLTNPYVTKYGIYAVDGNREYLVCADRQGGKKKKFDLSDGEYDDNQENLRVSDAYICYEKKEDLYVSPVRQTKEGEEIVWEEKEKVAHDVEVVCFLEPYLIYIGDTVYRYDLRSKESIPLGKKGEYDAADFLVNSWLQPVVHEGKLYFREYAENGQDTVYSLDIEKWEVRKLSIEMDDLTCYTFAGIQGTAMSLVKDNGFEKEEGEEEFLRCFDMDTGEKDILTCGEIFALLEKEKLWEKGKGSYNNCQLQEAFQYGEKIYLLVDMQWNQKRKVNFGPDKGKETEVWMDRPVLLSCPFGQIHEVVYEREISEWWYSRVNRHLDVDEGDVYEEFLEGDIHSLYQGELYMEYQDSQGHHMAACSLDTGKFREVSEKETAYYLFDEYALFR